ncbi:hypothetical protein [Janthinobacterium sp. B9-8]|nr:hypothetical protein [Janthinobacterium sp. B9-8]
MKPRIKFSSFSGQYLCYGQINGLTVREYGATTGEALARWANCVRLTFAP